MTDQVDSDLENGSINRHSVHDFYHIEDAGSDADHHAGRLAVYSRGLTVYAKGQSIN